MELLCLRRVLLVRETFLYRRNQLVSQGAHGSADCVDADERADTDSDRIGSKADKASTSPNHEREK